MPVLCAAGDAYHMMAEAELHARPDPVTSLKIGLGKAGIIAASGFSSPSPFLRGRGEEEENSVTCQIQWRMRLSECHLRLEERAREPLSIKDGWMRFSNNLLFHLCRIYRSFSLYGPVPPSLCLSFPFRRRRCLANEKGSARRRDSTFQKRGEQADSASYLSQGMLHSPCLLLSHNFLGL